jgi:hypothetical protein
MEQNLWQRFMIYMGWRSDCCYAKTYEPEGWEGRLYLPRKGAVGHEREAHLHPGVGQSL